MSTTVTPDPAVVTDVEGLTPEWLSAALGRQVDEVTAAPVGTGQIALCHRLTMTGPDGTSTLVAKLPAADPAARELLAGTYRSEVRFYADVAPTVAVRVPGTAYAAMAPEGGDFVLLLDDLSPAEQGDQIAGCTAEQARDAVVNLAGLHGPRWCDPTLLEVEGMKISDAEDAHTLAELYGPTNDLFLDIMGDRLGPEDAATLRACEQVAEQWTLARAERFGLLHGDYRLDNLLFPPNGAPGVVAVDWQTLNLGLPVRDLAYFVGTALDPEDRRQHERDLVAAYHAALTSYGVADYSLEDCWEDYRFAMLQGPLITVFGCAYGTRTERGDRMFATMIRRSCAAIRDLGTLDLV